MHLPIYLFPYGCQRHEGGCLSTFTLLLRVKKKRSAGKLPYALANHSSSLVAVTYTVGEYEVLVAAALARSVRLRLSYDVPMTVARLMTSIYLHIR